MKNTHKIEEKIALLECLRDVISYSESCMRCYGETTEKGEFIPPTDDVYNTARYKGWKTIVEALEKLV